MRIRLSAKIDLVNQLCELPLTPRDNNGRVIDPLTTSIQKIFTTVRPAIVCDIALQLVFTLCMYSDIV